MQNKITDGKCKCMDGIGEVSIKGDSKVNVFCGERSIKIEEFIHCFICEDGEGRLDGLDTKW